jgi:hypothetical protein
MRQLIVMSAAIALLSSGSPSSSQNTGSRVDPDAVAALRKMGVSLGSLRSFELQADVTQEQVLTTGQKLQFAGTVDVKARRPNAMRMEVNSDRKERTLFYDGKMATLFSPRIGYYATFEAPPTVAALLKVAADKYAIDTPLADLFVWGTDARPEAKLQSAFLVGAETINGRVCSHYAMRQPEADWQVWIADGSQALPCKLVITTTDDAAMPQYTAVYRWTPQQSFADSIFKFTPPSGARKIAIEALPTSASSR